MEVIDPKNIRSICINCCGLIGDTLIRTPFIEAIKKKYPHMSITVITDVDKTTLLSNHPDIDWVIVFNRNKKPILKYLKNLLNLLKHLRKTHYDLMINLYGGGSSTQITRLSKATHRWGFYYQDKHKTIYTHGCKAVDANSTLLHWGRALGILLSPFNIAPKDLRAGTTFVPTANARKEAKTILNTIPKPWEIGRAHV